MWRKVLFEYSFNMKEQEIKETLSDIREMMERSQKVMFLDGTAGIIAAVWALLGAVAVSLVLYGTVSPLLGAWINPIKHFDWSTFLIVTIICAAVFCAAFLTVWLMSKRRAERYGMEFKLDAGTQRLLGNFFTAMVVGGLVCLTPLFNGLWNMIPGFMLLFYGLALVLISPIAFRISITKYFGYAEIALGIAALALTPFGMMFWTIGFCILHLIWGIWFNIWFDRKQ